MTEQYIDKVSYQALRKRGDIINDFLEDNTKDPKYGLWYIEKIDHRIPGVPVEVNLKKLTEGLQIDYGSYIHLEIDKNLKDEEIIKRLNRELNSTDPSFDEIKNILKPENDGIESTDESQESKNKEDDSIITVLQKEMENLKKQRARIEKIQEELSLGGHGPTGGKRKSKKSKKPKKSKKSKTRKNSRKTNRRR